MNRLPFLGLVALIIGIHPVFAAPEEGPGKVLAILRADIAEKPSRVLIAVEDALTMLLLCIGAGLGLILGLLLAFFLEYLDTSVKSLDDVERYLGVPVLAVIPKDVGVLHKQSGLSPERRGHHQPLPELRRPPINDLAGRVSVEHGVGCDKIESLFRGSQHKLLFPYRNTI